LKKKEKPLRSLRLCGEKKDLDLTGSAHADEFYIITPPIRIAKLGPFSLAEGLRGKFNRAGNANYPGDRNLPSSDILASGLCSLVLAFAPLFTQ